MHDALARQMAGERPARGLSMLPLFAIVHRGRGGRCRNRCGRFVLGHALLELGKLQLQLIEELLATLGRGAERVALELGDRELQGLDLQPAVARLPLGGDHHRLQRCNVVGQLRRIERHGQHDSCFAPISIGFA